MEAKPAMSRGAAADLAARLDAGEPVIRSEQERKLIVAALRFYAKVPDAPEGGIR